MNNKITIIFPCAGEASRFGYTFKPFLNIGDLTFIEKAVQPFEKWEHLISNYHFIFTEQQDDKFSVKKNLRNYFENKNITFSILKNKTEGPLQTFSQGFLDTKLCKNRFIVCDCDHSINVDNLFKTIEANPESDIVIPTWDIEKNNQHNWSKILLNGNNIVKFIDKEDADFEKFSVKGIIGCIYFNKLNLFENLNRDHADFYKILSLHLENNKNILLSKVKNAYFYGDVAMLQNCIEKRRNEMSIFCDIDGVLLKHSDHSNNDFLTNEVLPDFKKLKQFSEANHKVILTTARSEKTEFTLRGY